MDAEFVCSVQKENNLGFYRIHSIWSNEGVRVNIAAKDAAWFGQVSQQKITETSNKFNQLPTEYLEDCKAALTTDGGLSGMVYAVEDGSFVWKKTIDEELGIKVQLGSIPLEPTSFVDTIQKMLDVALHSKQKLQSNLLQSTLEKEAINNSLTETFQKLVDCELKINCMENDLMTNFVKILNTKKCRISKLEQEIVMLKSSRAKKSSKNKTKTVDLNPYDVDTDEDMEVASAVKTSDSHQPPGSSSNDQGPSSHMVGSPGLGDVEPLGELGPQTEASELPLEVNQFSHNLENAKETSDVIKEKPIETLPTKSSDILDFFFGAVR